MPGQVNAILLAFRHVPGEHEVARVPSAGFSQMQGQLTSHWQVSK